MTMNFHSIFPDLGPWVKSLGNVFPASAIKAAPWVFPVIETAHLLGLATLGGCVIILNLRFMGAGLTNERAALIERNLRPWLWGAIGVLVVTGLLMSTVVAQRLYVRPAFLIKMLSLVSALILSLGVSGSLARNEGVLTQPAKIMAGIALAIWLLAITLFATSDGPAPGTLHLVCAGWLIVMAFGSKWTRILLGVCTVAMIIAAAVLTYFVYNPFEHYDLVNEIDRWLLRISAAVVVGFLGWEVAGPKPAPRLTPTLTRLVGLFTILVWVTVAASGRWIGLGGGAS